MKLSNALLLFMTIPIVACEFYRYLTFAKLSAYLYKFKEQYPDLIKLETAQERYNLPSPNCDNSQCPIYIVTLTNFATLSSSRPQVFISGALHGDEVLGPNICIYLLEYLLNNYGKNTWITYLIDNRELIVMPAANSQGYFYHVREEIVQGKLQDPNRDFPYDNSPSNCLTTLAGQSVARVIADHMFVLGITFHGGDALISYPWGSANHMANNKAEESPDDLSMFQLAEMLNRVGGSFPTPYLVGRTTDAIYSVNGGLEDWAYAASWTGQFELFSMANNCYGEDSLQGASKIQINEDNVRFPLYLMETDHNKHPNSMTWGTPEGIASQSGNGHIPRNVRIALSMMDMAEPYIRDISITYYDEKHIQIKWRVGGALYVNNTYIEWGIYSESKAYLWLNNSEQIDSYTNFTYTSNSQTGPAYWINPEYAFSVVVPVEDYKAINYAIRIAAVTDQQWARQDNPNPRLAPLTHFTKMRIERNYSASSGSAAINTDVVYYSPVLSVKFVTKLASLSSGFILLIAITALIITVGLVMLVRFFIRIERNKLELDADKSNMQVEVTYRTQ